MQETVKDIVKLADRVQRVISLRATIKKYGQTEREQLYRVTLPDGKLLRDNALFEVYASGRAGSHKRWQSLTTHGATANQLWEVIMENERKIMV